MINRSAAFRVRRCGVLLGVTLVALGGIPHGKIVHAQNASTPFSVVEDGRAYATLQEAITAIGDRKATISIANGTYQQCGVQVAGDISYIAQKAGAVIFERSLCEDKAALVLRGNSAQVAGIVFRGFSNVDNNGSGIRFEKGSLTVTQSWFTDSQQGILSGEVKGGEIIVDKSTFSGLGFCDENAFCAHSIYAGNIAHLRVTRSRFERGTGGHYVKSRAATTEIASSSFDDSQGKGTNYMIDLPSGSGGQISNNWFVQGKNKENHSTFIAVGAEPGMRYHSSDGLLIAGNDARFAPGVTWPSTFVAMFNSDKVEIGPNRLAQGIKIRDRR